MEEKKTHIFQKLLKTFLWVIVTLFVLLISARFALKTKFVHDFAKAKIENIANESLTSEVKISGLSGDLWEEIQLTGIYVGDTDTLAYVDTLYSRYELLSFLSGTFKIEQVDVIEGKVNIVESEQSADSVTSFTIQDIVKADTSESTGSNFKFDIQSINVSKTNISVYSPSLLPDSSLEVKNISLTAGFSMAEEIEASLSSLSFNIKEGRLPDAIKVKASGEYIDQTITLEDLVLNTGRSMLQANAFVNLKDSVLDSNLDMKPISTSDIQPYLDQEIPKEEVQISLKAKGGVDNIEIELTADSEFAKDIEAIANISFTEEPTLTKFGITGSRLNIAALTNDSVKAYTGVFQLTLDGELTRAYEKSDVTFGFTVEGVRYEDYTFRRFFGSGTLKEGQLLANADVTTSAEERIITNAKVMQLFAESPSWEVGYILQNLNAANWTENDIVTDISLNGFFVGQGFELSDNTWEFGLSNEMMSKNDPSIITKFSNQQNSQADESIKIGEQSIELVSVNGTINKDSITVEGFSQIIDSRVNFNAAVSSFLSDLPNFRYDLSTNDFNVNELVFVEEFPTSINIDISGAGSGSSLDDLKLTGIAHSDTSIVNGADINLLDARYEISEGILTIPEAELRSEIANANFSGRRNIRDEKDPNNILSFDAEIKNTQPLATLANLEILKVEGTLSADFKENDEGVLQCITTFDFIDIVADELFLASRILGNGNVVLREQEEGTFDVEVIEPQISGTSFQDIKITTNSVKTADSLYGDYTLDIKDVENGQILNSGDYQLELDSMNVNVVMNKLDFITKERQLNLQEEFNISVRNSAIRTDSLILTSKEGAFLSLSIPYADSVRQQIWLVGESFDFGILQEILLTERYVDGVLFGEINIDRTKDDLVGNGNIELQNLDYDGVEADVVSLTFDVKNKRLDSELEVIWDNKKVISGKLDVPFDLGDPKDFSDKFYDQEVTGNLNIVPTSLDRFKVFLEKLDVTGTSGILSVDIALSGTAGAPNVEGSLNIDDPVLSDIRLDSVFAKFGYNHEEENIFINAEVLAAKQKAADVDIDLPFSYNFKTFEVNTVDENQPVSATVTTKDFNLSVFNDFLDKDFTKNLRGTLNGELTLEGTENSLSSSGYFDLTKSSFEVPIAGITLDGIQSRIEFSESKIVLKEFKAKSGKGEFQANGDINLDGLTPTTLDITAKANQFKLANTDEYNLVVDIDSKLQGPALTPTSTGKFSVKNGFVVLDNFGDKSVEKIQLEGEEEKSFSLYDSLNIDMQFGIERNFFVRNRRYLDMEIEISGELEAQKETNGELSLFGSLTGEGGYLRPLGKRFELEEAELGFSGPADNPELNIKSVYVPASYKGEQEVQLYYIVTGTAENPQFSFESTPTMEKQDIICYTLFNRPCYALESWQNAFTEGSGASPTDLLTGVLIDEVEALATRELGVDVVQIDNTRVGNEVGTSIKTGWYLNERTFFAIVNEITSSDPKTLFILEYALSKTWDLIITEGEDSNRRGVDFRWQFDY
ncbi:MAG: translocation/assembly module TamB domain-containing protein [Balneola sp.]